MLFLKQGGQKQSLLPIKCFKFNFQQSVRAALLGAVLRESQVDTQSVQWLPNHTNRSVFLRFCIAPFWSYLRLRDRGVDDIEKAGEMAQWAKVLPSSTD